jgi:Na+-transporting NADH:ubiquinone oxidoreductase subunit C
MIVLSVISAFILSLMAAALRGKQAEARELDRTKEMLVAAQIYNPQGYFQIRQDGGYIPAKYVGDGMLVRGSSEDRASDRDILAVVHARIEPFLVDDAGRQFSFEEKKIDMKRYLAENKKKGYANLPLKIVYRVFPNPQKGERAKTPECYLIPISGFGLWDYMYGYLALAPDGDDVIGISWYEQKETPGLGGTVSEYWWQQLFRGKKIFQPDAAGHTDFERAPIGITIIKGKVKDVVGSSPKAACCVDGMAGATLTGNGVSRAYKDSLSPYRPFFISLHSLEEKGHAAAGL